MRLCGRNHLDALKLSSPSSVAWINSWLADLDSVMWKSIHEVKNHYPSAYSADGRSFIFKVDGCNAVIETIIDFNLLVVLVTSTKVM
nr:type II toxin-antitoxin system HigB family toxin [Pantoea ananatis]